jgi:hypothetical protein
MAQNNVKNGKAINFLSKQVLFKWMWWFGGLPNFNFILFATPSEATLLDPCWTRQCAVYSAYSVTAVQVIKSHGLHPSWGACCFWPALSKSTATTCQTFLTTQISNVWHWHVR